MNPSQTGICTSGASWVKRTTQGHFKCRGRSRMERRLRAFVKLHKERLQKSPLFDRETCRRAELPIVMRLYCSLVLYHTNSALSRGFRKIFCIIFPFDENRQKPQRSSPSPRGTPQGLFHRHFGEKTPRNPEEPPPFPPLNLRLFPKNPRNHVYKFTKV